MPFDGPYTGSDESCVLKALLAFFEDERKWLRKGWVDAQNRVCLEQALAMTRSRFSCVQDRSREYLWRAVQQHHRIPTHLIEFELVGFNDCLCSDFDELRDTIRLAIVLAENYAWDRLPFVPADPAPFEPWVDWNTAARGFAGLERSSSSPRQPDLFLRHSARIG